MRALVFDGQLRLAELPEPVPVAGEALIRVEYAAICNTDLELTRGYMGFAGVPGHEFVGTVVSAGRLQGKLVVGEINCPCGDCALCRRGLPTHCAGRSVLGIAGRQGAFAEYLVLPEANLHVVPDTVAPEAAVFVEPLAAALQIFEQVKVPPRDRVFLFGTGKLGMLVAMVLQQRGCDYRAFNRNPRKVDKARELGLHCDLLTDLPPDAQADIAIDCTGSPEGFALALSHLRPRGIVILKTTVASPPAVDLNRIVINEITVIGSRCGPFAPALKMLADGSIKVRPLISEVMPFTRALDAFAAAGRGDCFKIILKF
ncbi:MAG: hypothetical protein A2107_03870 [Verrucomicrobia bacterium GWF2_62_7]|nr:MAG: hypothetical protein A2107_03870 [Verrucomicrobia bacterium GWF2_62_7]